MGLGSLELVSLSEAREKADGARKLRLKGVDPITARKALHAAANLRPAASPSMNVQSSSSLCTTGLGKTPNTKSNGSTR